MFVVIGLGYATGGAHSMLTEAIGTLGLRLWGASITATGVFLMMATAKAKPSLEKFALRVLSSNLFAYAAWLLTVVPFARAGTTVILTASLIVLAEFRVLHLRQLMKRTSIIRYELNERDR